MDTVRFGKTCVQKCGVRLNDDEYDLETCFDLDCKQSVAREVKSFYRASEI